MKCKVCMDCKIASVWARDGSCNIQKDTISKHNDSTEHQDAEKKLVSSKVGTSSCCDEIQAECTDEVLNDNDCKVFRTVFCAANEYMSTAKINTLLELQGLNGLDIEYKNLSWNTVSEIQSCISTIIQRELVSDINESDVYAVMLDERFDSAETFISLCQVCEGW